MKLILKMVFPMFLSTAINFILSFIDTMIVGHLEIQVAALLYMVNYVCSSNKVYLIDITEYNPLMGNDNSELFFQFFKIICQMLEGNQIE